MAGYSKTPLLAKLGIRTGMRAHVVAPPSGYSALLGPLPDGARFLRRLNGKFDFIHVFAATWGALHRQLPRVVGALAKDGMLWISWPKRSSGVTTDIGETEVRRLGLAAGLVDVKICAVNEIWSGLKFVYRLSDR